MLSLPASRGGQGKGIIPLPFFPSDGSHGPLAQLAEHLTFNQVVAGSIPARPTNNQQVTYHFKNALPNKSPIA